MGSGLDQAHSALLRYALYKNGQSLREYPAIPPESLSTGTHFVKMSSICRQDLTAKSLNFTVFPYFQAHRALISIFISVFSILQMELFFIFLDFHDLSLFRDEQLYPQMFIPQTLNLH